MPDTDISLRPFCEADAEAITNLLLDEQVKQTYMLPDFTNREAAIPLFLRLAEMSQDPSKYVRAIAVDDSLAGFLNHTEITDTSIELGYVIHPDCQRKGYMTQALSLAIDELFSLRYRQVITGAFSTNAASIRVMEKCGMQKIALTEEIEYRGKVHKCIYYAITK